MSESVWGGKERSTFGIDAAVGDSDENLTSTGSRYGRLDDFYVQRRLHDGFEHLRSCGMRLHSLPEQ